MTENCERCGDQPSPEEIQHLVARCHLPGPLSASIVDGILNLRCYLPDCGREVATFRIRLPTRSPEEDFIEHSRGEHG